MEWVGLPNKIEDYESFVYLITNTLDGRKYVGKKVFWSNRKLKPLKGYKRKRKVKVKSDYETYYGSSNSLNEDVRKYGEDKFKREILHLCKTRFDASYMELYEQIQRGVLFDDNYYNGFIGVKLNKRSSKYSSLPSKYKHLNTK